MGIFEFFMRWHEWRMRCNRIDEERPVQSFLLLICMFCGCVLCLPLELRLMWDNLFPAAAMIPMAAAAIAGLLFAFCGGASGTPFWQWMRRAHRGLLGAWLTGQILLIAVWMWLAPSCGG